VDDETLTARLRCRRPVPGPQDAERYRSILLDPAVARWLAPPPLPALDAAGARVRLARDAAHWERHGFGPWIVLDRADGAAVGRVGLQWLEVGGRPVLDLAWAVMSARQGLGLATEAARAALDAARSLGLPEPRVMTMAQNAASRAWPRSSGSSPTARSSTPACRTCASARPTAPDRGARPRNAAGCAGATRAAGGG
jgi:RimJ/RimL family protein N-acetyltransferase